MDISVQVPFDSKPKPWKQLEQEWLDAAKTKLKEVHEFRQQQLLPYVKPSIDEGYNQTLDGIDCMTHPITFPKEASHEDQARTSDVRGVRDEDSGGEVADAPRYLDVREAQRGGTAQGG